MIKWEIKIYFSRVYQCDKSIYKTKIVKVFNIKLNVKLVELSEYCVSKTVKTIYTYVTINYVS